MIREGNQAQQSITPTTISGIMHAVGKLADIRSKMEKLYLQIKTSVFRKMKAKTVVKEIKTNIGGP